MNDDKVYEYGKDYSCLACRNHPDAACAMRCCDEGWFFCDLCLTDERETVERQHTLWDCGYCGTDLGRVVRYDHMVKVTPL